MADTNSANLNPLPLGLEQPKPAATDAPIVANDSLDPTEAWMQEHPADKEFSAETTAAATTTDVTPAPDASTPQPTATTDAPAATAQPATTATTTDAQPKPADATATAQPAAQPAAKTLAADEKIALADGVEWTREQVVTALKERSAQAPLAKEGDSFRKLFGMPFEEAQKAWSPILQRLATEQNTVAFLDGYLGDPAKAAYLERCAAHYDQQSGTPAPGAPQPVVTKDPELVREVAELRSWRETQEREAAQNRLNNEWAQATQKYPFLATDLQLRNDLILTAQALFAQDKSKGLLDALELKRPMYEAIQIARSSQPAPTPTPAPEPVAAQPAILGSPGASPTGARPASSTRPKTFGSLDDAVDDWASNPPTEFK